MRLASGVTDQYLYFVAIDSSDHISRKTGLSSFTVYRSRNGGAATAYTTPTITELDSTNMPGVYKFLIDEDMTIDSGDETQEVALHITATGMDPVTRVFELYRPKITAGETLNVSSGALNAISDGLLTAAKFASGALDAVWSTATRLLTAGTNIVLAKGTGVTGFNDLDAAGVRSAVGLASANLDTQIATLAVPGDQMDLVNAPNATAITAIQSGLSTLDAAGVRTAVGLASANLDTQIAALPTAAENRAEIDSNSTQLAAIKAKTDNLPASPAAVGSSMDIASVNGVPVGGSGTEADPWGPA